MKHRQTYLFDMDGTLVDTETIGIYVAKTTCRTELGFEMTQAEIDSYYGLRDDEFFRQLLAARDMSSKLQKVLKTHFEHYDSLLLGVEIRWFPGGESFPRRLKVVDARWVLCQAARRKKSK